MNPVVAQNVVSGLARGDIRRVARRRFARPTTNRMAQSATTRVDRLLLIAAIALLPLENHIPAVFGFSVLWILFAVIGLYVLLNRPQALLKTWLHPIFVTAYGLIIVGLIAERFQPNSAFGEPARIGQMIAGAVLIASLCRDRKALASGIYGYLIAGLWLSVLLYLTSYGALSAISMTDTSGLSMAEVTHLRGEVFMDSPIDANLNLMALVAAQAAVVALALMMTSANLVWRIILSACASFCITATFLPLSRSGVVTFVVASACVIYSLGLKHSKAILMASLICVGAAQFVPDVVWSRMKFSMGSEAVEQKDGRAKVYEMAIEHFPEYAISGVGSGNFWKSREIRDRLTSGTGSHNGFLQVTIYWGLLGLLSLLAVVWQVWRHVPRGARNDGLALCLVGISVTLLCELMVIHNLYSKEFTLGIGLLVGARKWIWPERRLQRTSRKPTQSLMIPSANSRRS